MLTIPLEIRALNWFLQNKQGKYASFYEEHISYADAIYAFLSTIVPVLA